MTQQTLSADNGETIYVEITGECVVKYSKFCEIPKTEFDRYEELINSNESPRKIDRQLQDIAGRYLASQDNEYDWGDFEEVTIEPRTRP